MMRPPPASRIRRAPSWPHRKTARTLTAKTSSKTSTLRIEEGDLGRDPRDAHEHVGRRALEPVVDRQRRPRRSARDGRDRTGNGGSDRRRAARSRRRRAGRGRPRARPRAANMSATPWPIPRAAPVTTTRAPCKPVAGHASLLSLEQDARAGIPAQTDLGPDRQQRRPAAAVVTSALNGSPRPATSSWYEKPVPRKAPSSDGPAQRTAAASMRTTSGRTTSHAGPACAPPRACTTSSEPPSDDGRRAAVDARHAHGQHVGVADEARREGRRRRVVDLVRRSELHRRGPRRRRRRGRRARAPRADRA